MGETGIRILVRIMGLLLVALAMQFFVNGLTDLGVIRKQLTCDCATARGFPQKRRLSTGQCGLLSGGWVAILRKLQRERQGKCDPRVANEEWRVLLFESCR